MDFNNCGELYTFSLLWSRIVSQHVFVDIEKQWFYIYCPTPPPTPPAILSSYSLATLFELNIGGHWDLDRNNYWCNYSARRKKSTSKGRIV